MATKSSFLESAKQLAVTVHGTTLYAEPKQFSTGSVGYNVTGKVPVTLPDGTVVKLQVSGNLTVIGSKDWQEAA
jgi:hypothetical protein